MCNVSNQARGAAEDARNKPWRPLPAGRITESQALVLRWAAVAVCVWLSAGHGLDVVLATLALVVTTVVYDELGLAGHYVGKNFCNIGGYASFEVGATKLIGVSHRLRGRLLRLMVVPRAGASRTMDHISTTAVCISSALIFTTIHAQDFADVAGDRELGRRTLPIHAPELSRRITLVALCAWSAFLCWYWGVGPVCSASYVALGVVIAVRFYVWRSAEADRRSYLLYNVRASTLELSRTGVNVVSCSFGSWVRMSCRCMLAPAY